MMAQSRAQTIDRHKDRAADAALKRDLRAALGDVECGPAFVGEVRVPGEAFNRRLYRRRDGIYVAGQPVTQ